MSLLVLALVTGWSVAARGHQQQPPTFRGSVDLVVVDVVVLDSSGQPVTDLTAADFEITAGKRARRIVSSEFISVTSGVGPAPQVPEPLLVAVPPPAQNRPQPPGRSLLFVVDVDEIRAGEGRAAMHALADYIDTLSPTDRVGVVALPYGAPRVELTTDRAPVADALRRIVGASRRMRSADMTPGEAQQIARGDSNVLADYFNRARGQRRELTAGLSNLCPPPPGLAEPELTVSPVCTRLADLTLDFYRRRSRNLLDSMSALAGSMQELDGSKALVLVSEGLYTDSEVQADLKRFAEAAERARVALYAIHLNAPVMEATTTGGPTAMAAVLDDHVGFEGMSVAAGYARGTAFRAVANPLGAVRTIDRELSGYYLLAFERSAEDKEAAHVPIDVRVRRAGLDVRARRQFIPTPAPSSSPTRSGTAVDPRAAMATALHFPVPLTGIPIALDTFTSAIDGQSPSTRLTVVAEIANDGRPFSVGLEATNDAGKVVSDTLDADASPMPLPDGRSLYPIAFVVPPGRYSVRFAVIDADGRRGSVSQAIATNSWPKAAIRLSSVMFGTVADRTFRPTSRPESAASLAVRIEAHAATPEPFYDLDVRLDVLRRGETTPLITTEGRLSAGANPLMRASTTLLDLADLSSGDFVVRVTLERKGEVVAWAARGLRRE